MRQMFMFIGFDKVRDVFDSHKKINCVLSVSNHFLMKRHSCPEIVSIILQAMRLIRV
jgi:hypothetical protein